MTSRGLSLTVAAAWLAGAGCASRQVVPATADAPASPAAAQTQTSPPTPESVLPPISQVKHEALQERPIPKNGQPTPNKSDDTETAPTPKKSNSPEAAPKSLLNDDKPGAAAKPAVGLTLDQAINFCLLNDPKIRAGFEAINQASADALTASLKPNPILFTDIQLLPLTRPFTVQDQGGPPQYDFQVSYPIDWYLFGKRAAAMASAALGVKQSEADYADLIRQRVTQAALAYYDLLEGRALLALAHQDVENLRTVEEASRKAVEAGGRPTVELSRVRLDLLKSLQAVRDAEVVVGTARAKLRALLGRADAAPTFELSDTLDRTFVGDPPDVEEAIELAKANRPDLRSLRVQIDKARADMDVERRKAYPDVTPQIGYTRQFQRQAIGFPDANSYMTSLTMSLPIYNRNQGNRAKAQSVYTQNILQLQSGEVDLRAELEQVSLEYRAAYQTARAVAQEQLQLAGQVRDSIVKAYAAGGRPLLDVLDAQRNYRDTYRLYISSRASYWRAVYRFHSAIGGEVTPNARQPAQSPAGGAGGATAAPVGP
ncbi:TolC family protein [Fimbriiglobus ruber]|uniref:TolC family protein n=1 Tax=Fimbriiglobus ruber TaxID=1908690 RepID=UPI00117A204C|nr:TolC family protein [Fimbriiglobus ruber]